MASDGRPTLRMGTVAFAIAIGVLLLFLLRFSPIRLIPAGHVGVLTVFGRVTGQVVGEGVNVVNPLATTHVMSIRTQEVKESASVPSKEGLILRMDTRYCSISIRITQVRSSRRSVRTTWTSSSNPICDRRFGAPRRKIRPTRSTPDGASWLLRESSPSSERPSRTAAWSSRTCC
jgi:regulator of protease activity HflC (stomatin/prohibitin superfamily)